MRLSQIETVTWLDHRCYEPGCIRKAMNIDTARVSTPFMHEELGEVGSNYSVGQTLNIVEEAGETAVVDESDDDVIGMHT